MAESLYFLLLGIVVVLAVAAVVEGWFRFRERVMRDLEDWNLDGNRRALIVGWCVVKAHGLLCALRGHDYPRGERRWEGRRLSTICARCGKESQGFELPAGTPKRAA